MNSLFKGSLRKMNTVLLEAQVSYSLEGLDFNALLGKSIQLHFLREIHCIQCGRLTNKSFQGGYCFPCFRHLQNSCNLCVIHPERCRYPEGSCNSNDWAHAICGKSHIVYLSNTVHVKVGITRKTQVPTRWIDQGAIQAIPLFKVSNRYQAGQMEVMLKQFFPDKTPWQAMLKNQVTVRDLVEIKKQLFLERKEEIQGARLELGEADIELLEETEQVEINYPVMTYPEKVKAFNFDKKSDVAGTLLGIKGQYLILDTGVLNIRKFSGYEVEILG